MRQDELKKEAALQAAQEVQSGMVVGMGTGSTAWFFVEELGRRIREEDLQIIGIPTSEATRKQAVGLNIPLATPDDVDAIDLTVDGADEFDPQLNGIKGGGGALLFEKIVAIHSKRIIWITDARKQVDQLGRFPLPVEVVRYGAQALYRELEAAHLQPKFRMHENQRFLTDAMHYIIDLHLNQIDDPQALARQLKSMTGVVEHGLFLDMTDTVIVAKETGIEVLKRNR